MYKESRFSKTKSPVKRQALRWRTGIIEKNEVFIYIQSWALIASSDSTCYLPSTIRPMFNLILGAWYVHSVYVLPAPRIGFCRVLANKSVVISSYPTKSVIKSWSIALFLFVHLVENTNPTHYCFADMSPSPAKARPPGGNKEGKLFVPFRRNS